MTVSITLGPRSTVHRYELDNGQLLIVEAEQGDGAKCLTREQYLQAPLRIGDRDAQYVIKGPLERTGVEACLTLKSTNLTNSEGSPVLPPGIAITSFLPKWADPALGEVALTSKTIFDDDGVPWTWTYRDLIMEAIYEVNPRWDMRLFRPKPPKAGELPSGILDEESGPARGGRGRKPAD